MIRSLIRKKPVARWAKTAIGLGSSLAAIGALHAQTPAAATGETAQPDRIVVTGSNIPTAETVGSAPVTTLDAAAIGRTGIDDPQVVLQKSDPSFSGGGNLGNSNASVSSGATNGGSAVSLRGLPTLVLLNGRRIADSAAVAAGGAQFQDVNLFPTALIKRIEVLKDGASAIYGSDAVGGVVNVLLNDDFQGVAISGRFGFTEAGDIQDQRYSGVAGFGDEHTRIVVAGQYQEQDPIFSTQRDFARNAPGSSNFGDKITIAASSRYLNTGFASVPAQVIPFATPPNLNSPITVLTPGSIQPVFNLAGQQVFGPNQTAPAYGTAARTLLLQQFTGVTLDQNRTNAYGSFERDIIDKHLVAFGDFLYSRNYSQSYLAPQPVATNSSPNPSQNEIIAFGAPFNPFNSQIGIEQAQLPTTGVAGTTNGVAGNYGGLVVSNRFLSAPRVFRNDTDFYRIVSGLKGEIIKDYNYEVAFNHSEDTINFKNFNLVRGDLLNQAIAGGYNADGTAAPATFTTNAAGATVVATPAGAYSRVNGVLLPALDPFAFNNPAATEQAVLGTDIRNQQSKLTVIDGKITGFPVTLPAGPLGFAVGGEYRREELRLNSSVENFVASVPAADVQVGRDIEAAYLEVSIPVVGPNLKIPGVYSFDIDAAGRYENYERTGDVVTPKVSVIYRPIVDVAFRGTYSKSFRAPNLIETNGPPGSGFSALVNLGAGFNEQANVISSANPALGPERTDSFSTGLVLSPHQVPGLTISADFFHVEERNIITSGVPASTILLSANALGAASPYNALIHQGSQTGPSLTSNAAGQLTGNASNFFIFTAPANNTNIRESGIDFTFNYDHDFGPFGGITLGLNGTYYLQYKENDTKGSPMYDVVGLYLGGIGGSYVPDYKLVPYMEYRYGGASVSALMNYIPSMRNGGFLDSGPGRRGNYTQAGDTNLPKIRDYYDIDMTLSYEFGLNKPAPAAPAPAPKDGKDGKGDGKEVKATSQQMAKQMMNFKLLDGLKLTFGVNNITNARPPFIAGSPDSTNTDTAVYDPFQRTYYFVLSKKF